MGRCLTTDQLISLASDSLSERHRRKLARHCEHCAVCRGLLEEWRENQQYAGEIRRTLGSSSSVASSEVAVAGGLSGTRYMLPLMSADAIRGYEILGEIHRGGQGVVYRAIQKSTQREVAIKVAFEETPSAGKRPHRFDREVELASKLKHPNIIAIFDSGTTPDGRCYFVMDYVHGLPVDQFIRERELSLRQAMELFIAICEAVNHAHQRGVIHRDLKPSNILVEGEGIPRVLDFGLAKALSGGGIGRMSSVVSAAGQLLGTVPYMSPEQLAGRPQAADIRVDVYALGVLLYEILAGALPYDIGLPASEMLRRISEGSPTPPSRRWNPVTGIAGQASAGIRHAGCPVSDDLDAITLQAMALSPERRYQNAADLARDVRRYLDGAPVEAKRDRGFYVFRKLLSRYRLPAAIAAGFVVLLAGGLAVITTLYIKVEEQREVAQTERDRAVRAQQSADSRADQLREVMYVGHVSAALAAGDGGDLTKAREELYVCPADLRGWEWYWLVGQFDHPSRVLRGHSGQVTHVLDSDGGYVASGSLDGTVRFWNIAGREPGPATLPVGVCRDVKLSPDGQSLAVRDLEDRVSVRTIAGDEAVPMRHEGAIRGMRFSEDSKRLAIGNAAGYIDICDAGTGERVQRLGRHAMCAYCVAFSPDGRRLASGSWDKTVRIWDVESGQEIFVLAEQGEEIATVEWSRDGRRLFSGGDNGSLVCWDAEKGKLDMVLQPKRDHITCLACSPDDRLVVSADLNRRLCFWDSRTGQLAGKTTLSDTWLRTVAFTKDSRWLIAGGNDGTIRLWELERTPYTISIKAHDKAARALAFGPGGLLGSASDDRTVRLWETPSGRLLQTFVGHEDLVRAVAFSPDGAWVVSGSMDRTVRVWDTASGSERLVLRGHEDCVLAVAVSPDGRLIASGGSDFLTKGKDNSVRIWDSSTGAELHCLRVHKAGVPALAFSPDGGLLVSGGRDRQAIVWEVKSMRPVATFAGHQATVRAVAFGMDGKSVISVAEDNTVQTWDPWTGQLLAPPLSQPKTLVGVSLSPDGSRKVTCGNWGHIALWPQRDINWELLRLPSGHPSVWATAFSRDGTCLAASDERGEIMIWRSMRPADLARSPRAAEDLAAGAIRLWKLRQPRDAELLFNESLGMHRVLFGTDDPRTRDLEQQLEAFHREYYFFETPPADLSVSGRSATQPAT